MHAALHARLSTALVFLAGAACALPTDATVLYKSIGPNGVIQFSDTPPETGVVVEERIVGQPSDGAPIAGAMGPDMLPGFENPLELAADNGLELGDALAKANAQVDLAEHALALARASTWTRREGLRLQTWRRAQTDAERIAFYERSLAAARANLLALMKTGQSPVSPATQVAEASATLGTSSPFRQ